MTETFFTKSGSSPGVGSSIFMLRRARGLTRQQLANLSSVHRCVIFQIEIGRTKAPQIRVLEKLAAALGVGVGRLVNERGAMLTTLEDALIKAAVPLVRNLNQLQRFHVLSVMRRIGGPSWARKRSSETDGDRLMHFDEPKEVAN